MVPLDKVLRWAPGSRWSLHSTMPAALLRWLEGRDPLLASCLDSAWELVCLDVGTDHADLRISGSNGAQVAVSLRYAANGSIDAQCDMTLGERSRSLRRGALAVMLGGKHDAYLAARETGGTRMLLHLAYQADGLGAVACSAYTEAIRERVPKYLQALLPQEVALCAVSAAGG